MIRLVIMALLAVLSVRLSAETVADCVGAHAINSGALQNRFVRLRGVLS